MDLTRPNSKIHNSIFETTLKGLRRLCSNKLDNYIDKLNPAYGHGQVLMYPDIPYFEWEYKYDYSDEFSQRYKVTKIDNKLRFDEAFKKIHIFLENYLKNNPKYKDGSFSYNNFEALFNTLVKEGSIKERINNWRKVMIVQQLFCEADTDIISYKEDLWLIEAFKNYQRSVFRNRKVENVEINTDFEDSNWYKYYKAVKWYKEQFFKYSKKHLLEIPR